jgi:nitroreductase
MTKTAERPLTALDAIYTRRSVRSFQPVALEESTVRGLLDAAVQAPTAMHRQPWLFAIVQDRTTLRWLSMSAKRLWESRGHGDGPPNRADGTEHSEFAARFAAPAFDLFHDAGTLVVICARETDAFSTADCWLAAGNLMLAASALGLGTCCIGAALDALNTPEGKVAIGIPAAVTAIAPIVVGVPAGASPLVSRLEPQIVSWR